MMAWLLLGLSLAATVAGQLLFKGFHRNGRRMHVVAAVGLFLLAVPLTVLAARDLGIGRVYIATALTYVAAPLAASMVFGERVGRTQWGALLLILAGVAIYNI
jgi:multidrug transporter EmrE-like cation transporter